MRLRVKNRSSISDSYYDNTTECCQFHISSIIYQDNDLYINISSVLPLTTNYKCGGSNLLQPVVHQFAACFLNDVDGLLTQIESYVIHLLELKKFISNIANENYSSHLGNTMKITLPPLKEQQNQVNFFHMMYIFIQTYLFKSNIMG